MCINFLQKVGIYWHFEAAKLLPGCKHHEEIMVAGLLCIYILWLGFELQVFGVKTRFELGIVEGWMPRMAIVRIEFHIDT